MKTDTTDDSVRGDGQADRESSICQRLVAEVVDEVARIRREHAWDVTARGPWAPLHLMVADAATAERDVYDRPVKARTLTLRVAAWAVIALMNFDREAQK